MEKAIQKKAIDALAGLVERHGEPTHDNYEDGRAALADLRALIAPVENKEGGNDGNT